MLHRCQPSRSCMSWSRCSAACSSSHVLRVVHALTALV
jgi:hypothetical protein